MSETTDVAGRMRLATERERARIVEDALRPVRRKAETLPCLPPEFGVHIDWSEGTLVEMVSK